MSHEVVYHRRSLAWTLLKVLAVTAVLVVVAGSFLGWFSFSSSRDESDADSKLDFTVTVNEDEIRRDADALKDKLAGLKGSAGMSSKIQSVEGKVESVNMETGELVVKPADSDKPTTLKVDEDTKFKLGNGKTSLSKLEQGDEVIVTFVKQNDVRHAKTISRLESKS